MPSISITENEHYRWCNQSQDFYGIQDGRKNYGKVGRLGKMSHISSHHNCLISGYIIIVHEPIGVVDTRFHLEVRLCRM